MMAIPNPKTSGTNSRLGNYSEDDRRTSHAANELNQEKLRGQNSQKSSVEFRPSNGQVMPAHRKKYFRMNLVTS